MTNRSSLHIILLILSVGCAGSANEGTDGTGGSFTGGAASSGGAMPGSGGTGGAPPLSSGGTSASGGSVVGSGGDPIASTGANGGIATGGLGPATGGGLGSGGAAMGTGGVSSTGGAVTGTGGVFSTGGAATGTGGVTPAGGSDMGTGGGISTGGGDMGTGGGDMATGGTSATGGAASVELDCDAAMPTSGAEHHSGNGVGGEGNLAWEIWSNTGNGELTTYDVPAFSAFWNEAGGYLGRLGYEWGGFMDNPVPHEQLGTITAQFVAHREGTAGGYSYIGMYGWSTDPCVEWYVVEDTFGDFFPFNPGDTTLVSENEYIDGEEYIIYSRVTPGTGGTRCSGVSEWIQYYSFRKSRRSCGQISLTEHFNAWERLGLNLGNLLEAKILVEVGGGTGRVDLPVANVILTP